MVIAAAGEMGSVLSAGQLDRITREYFKLGWSDQQLRQALATHVKVKDGFLQGKAGQDAQALREIAYQNGVRYNDDWFTNAAQSVASGSTTVDKWEQSIRANAAAAFPPFAEQIKAGQNVADIASPYRQTMGALLELNPNDIDLFDPTIRQAIAGRDPKTGQATAKSLWQFENDMRKDKRWLKTNNARESLMGTAQNVLSKWGFNG
jgi:hypothetical protein